MKYRIAGEARADSEIRPFGVRITLEFGAEERGHLGRAGAISLEEQGCPLRAEVGACVPVGYLASGTGHAGSGVHENVSPTVRRYTDDGVSQVSVSRIAAATG